MGTMDATGYDKGMWFFERFSLRRRRARLLAGVGGRVLEIGAGTGANMPFYRFEENGVELIATDVNMPRLRALPTKAAHVPILLASAQELPFPDASFDVVVGTLVFCSIPDPAAALHQIKRVLRPGGRLVLFEHVRGKGTIGGKVTDWLQPAWFALQHECHLNRRTTETVAEAGFEITYHNQDGWFGLLSEIEATNPS